VFDVLTTSDMTSVGCYGFSLLTRKLPKLAPALFILSTKLYFTLPMLIMPVICNLLPVTSSNMFHEKDLLFRDFIIVMFVKNVSNLFQVTEALSLVIKLAEYLAKLPKVSVDLTIRQTVHNKLHGIE